MTTKDLAIQWFEQVWNQRNRLAIPELADEACFGKSEGGNFLSPEHFRVTHFEPLLRAFPDLHIRPDEVVDSGDIAVVRWTATATHLGTWLGITPSGLRFQFSAMSWLEFRNGKLLKSYDHFNLHGLIAFLTGKGTCATVLEIKPDAAANQASRRKISRGG
jgi:steroid delta-isomerase-like uncharacterized protein